LAELAEIARAEEEFWESEADGWLGTGIQKVQPQTAASQLVQLAPVGGSAQFSIPAGGATNLLLDLAWLLSEETAVQRRIIKAAAGEAGLVLDFQHIEEVLRFAAQEGSVGKELFLPGGWKVLCGEDALELVAPHLTIADAEKTDYELRLPIPGEVIIAQTGSRLQAIVLQGEDQLPANANPEHLFDAALLNEFLTVRNWRPGDRFWPAHSKSPKKIKELLQQRHVPQAERARWPVILSRDELIWVRGFPGRAHMRPGEGKPAVLIREQPPKERV
jgi:tRNA(Ile)-lysidine synthetase-like protein